MLIKLWDWEKKWQCSQVFEGHSHYVMMIVLNPKDNNQFVSASLDRTVKVCVQETHPQLTTFIVLFILVTALMRYYKHMRLYLHRT